MIFHIFFPHFYLFSYALFIFFNFFLFFHSLLKSSPYHSISSFIFFLSPITCVLFLFPLLSLIFFLPLSLYLCLSVRLSCKPYLTSIPLPVTLSLSPRHLQSDQKAALNTKGRTSTLSFLEDERTQTEVLSEEKAEEPEEEEEEAEESGARVDRAAPRHALPRTAARRRGHYVVTVITESQARRSLSEAAAAGQETAGE